MSLGYTRCPYCNSGEAEKLYGVDDKVECYCHNCYAEWTTDAAPSEVITRQQQYMAEVYGDEYL